MEAPLPVNETLLKQYLAELEAMARWTPRVLSDLERFVRTASDYDIFRVNPIQYAGLNGLGEDEAIELFVHAAKAGLFEMQWLLICAYCPQVAGNFRELDEVHPRFQCEFCNALNDVALDDYIHVTFTVATAVRDIVFRHPEMLSIEDYYLRYNFSKGFIAPHGMTHQQLVAALSRGFADIEAGQHKQFEFDVTAGRFELLDLSHRLLLVFFANGEPAASQSTQVRLESGRFTVPERPVGPRDMVLGDGRFAFRQTADLKPGRHVIAIENHTAERGRFWFLQYPSQFEPHRVEYEPFLSGRRLLLTPCFGDLYKTQLVDERESLAVSDITYLFTDLKDSTPLYETVGDVNAYFLVRQHFDILNKVIRERSGTIVKTIGDAVMATFATPDRALAAALRMREAMRALNATHGREDLLLKIGIHEGPCLAVSLNERKDYFGQTVNIASRVQGLAISRSILATAPVIDNPQSANLLGGGEKPKAQHRMLRGVGSEVAIYEIP
jgi:class 3 adenylate cyclase